MTEPTPCRCGAEDCPRCHPMSQDRTEQRLRAEELADYLIDQRKDDEMTDTWERENA